MPPGSRPIHGTRPASISTMPTSAMTAPTMTRARPTSGMASLEETALPALSDGRLPLQMQVCFTSHPPARRRAHDEADLQEIGLHYLRERLGLVVDRGRDGLDADGAPAVVLDDGGQESPVEPIETSAVHAFLVERVMSYGGRDDPVAGYLGVVADPTQQTIHDPWRAAGAPGDLARSARLDLGAEDLGGAEHDAGQLGFRVEVEVVEDPEALAERRREHPRPRGGAHQREWRQPMLEGARIHAALHHEVHREILHRRIQQLFHHPRKTMDLVDEEDVVLVEVGQDPHEAAAPLHRPAGGRDEVRAHLVGDHARERGLAQTGWAVEQDVIDALAAAPGGFDGHAQARHRLLLAHVLGERPRTELTLELGLLGRGGPIENPRN